VFSIVCIFFLIIGAVSAVDSLNVLNTEDSNFMGDNDNSLSLEDKLEISSEYSISETNIVDSHDDNLGSDPADEVLNISADSDNVTDADLDEVISADSYEDNNQQVTSSYVEVENDAVIGSSSSSIDRVATDVSSSDVVGAAGATVLSAKSATLISTKLSVTDTHYGKSATTFEVTLKDKNGNSLSNQKISLKVNKKTYSAVTNAKGIALVKAAKLNIGTYTVSLNYVGNSNYSASSLSKKVKVLSSAVGSDLTKYYGYTSKYKVKFWKDNSVLANTKVTFKINGKTYTRITNDNGVAGIYISLPNGKYEVTTINPYSNEKISHKIVVKKDKTDFKVKGKTFIHPKTKGSFSIVLKSKHNVLLRHKEITFTYNHKTVTAKTNANGKAVITIPVLAKGTYDISFKFDGSDNYYASSGQAKLKVANPTTRLYSSVLVMHYNDGSKLKVKLTDSHGNNLANKEIKFKVKGKSIVSKTNSHGNARLSLKDIKPGYYDVKYSHLAPGFKDYNYGSVRVIILKAVAKVSAKDLTMKVNDGSAYQVKVKDQAGNLLKGVYVKSAINNGNSHIYRTDSNGVAKLIITKGVGCHSIKTLVADPLYKSAPTVKKLTVKGTKVIAKDAYVSAGHKTTYSVKLVNEKNKPVKNKKIVFTFKGKNKTAVSNSKGMAKLKLGALSKGTYKLNYQLDSSNGTSKIYAIQKVSIKNIIKGSKKVQKYISKHSKLPSKVKIGSIPFKTADYLYLASKAIVNLKKGNKKSIPVKILDNPKKAKAASNLGFLKDYRSVAKSVVKTAESKGRLPNSVGSNVGTIGYKGLVNTFSSVLSYYGKHKEMPTYIEVKSLSKSDSSSITGALNFKNSIKNLAPYLAASRNCEVNDAQIVKLVTKLTKNCKSDKEKATVIYNFVRDTVSYSFYYDTKYGAIGTLKAKTGNCVDHAHLAVAMFRSAGLAARYVHGTCHFSSGGTYGHVWAQVLIGNTWTVADATSARNSLGYVANWNTNSYTLHSYSSTILF
jgi:hypothetical protein